MLSVAISGCSTTKTTSSENKSDKIYFGFVGPLTGTAAYNGQQALNGTKLAISQINAAGGINGKQIELIVSDDKADPTEAANIASKYAQDERIVAVLGNYNSSNVLSGGPIYAEANLAMIHMGASPKISRDKVPSSFRISVTDAMQTKFIAKWLSQGEKIKTYSIFYENTDYGKSQMTALGNEFKALGVKNLSAEAYELGQSKDFKGGLTKVNSLNPKPDALFISGGYTEAALILKQAKELGINIPVFSSSGIYEKALINLAGQAAEGLRLSGGFYPDDPNPKVQAFVNDYVKTYETDPGTWSATQYDGVYIFAQAIKTVGTDRKKIVDYISKLPAQFEGVTGSFVFDDKNDSSRLKLYTLIVKNGKWELYTPPSF